MPLHPLISWEKVIGTASIRCVLPLLMIPRLSSSSFRRLFVMASSAGRSFPDTWSTAAICIAVGKVSFELWDIFTVSFGWRQIFPASSFPLFAITSFRFILDCVPLPVCQTASGNSPSSFPSRISSQTELTRRHFSSSRRPSRLLAMAAAFFR